MTVIFTLSLLFLCLSLQAQIHADKELYDAYLRSDMSTWEQYINSADWQTLDKQDQLRRLGYEYGFVASAIGAENKRAGQYLQDFENHIESLRSILSPSDYKVYLSAAAAYHVSLDGFSIKQGLRSVNLAKEAVELDSLNPLALTLRANIDFYSPKIFGGDKARALRHLLSAEKQWEKRKRTEYNWNYLSVKLCIAQCYEKLGKQQKAIEKCEEIVRMEPEYQYVTQTYLPQLRGEKPVSETTAGSQVAGKILK